MWYADCSIKVYWSVILMPVDGNVSRALYFSLHPLFGLYHYCNALAWAAYQVVSSTGYK